MWRKGHARKCGSRRAFAVNYDYDLCFVACSLWPVMELFRTGDEHGE